MKIWGDVSRVFGVYNKQNSVNNVKKTNSTVMKKDELSISSAAKDFQTVMAELSKVPEVREDKVSEIKQKLESGNYNVDSKEISQKILQGLARR